MGPEQRKDLEAQLPGVHHAVPDAYDPLPSTVPGRLSRASAGRSTPDGAAQHLPESIQPLAAADGEDDELCDHT